MNIECTIKVKKVDVSAKEWQLYTESMNCTAVAKSLNRNFKYFANVKGATPETVYREMNKVRNMFPSYGASDSEPRYVLQDLIKQVFGRYPDGVINV